MSKVYVPQERIQKDNKGQPVPNDWTAAARYGEVVILFPPGDVSMLTEPVRQHLAQSLRTFSDDDYICPMGSPQLMMWAAMFASEYNGGRVAVLMWDRMIKDYLPRRISLRPPPRSENNFQFSRS